LVGRGGRDGSRALAGSVGVASDVIGALYLDLLCVADIAMVRRMYAHDQ
jgi:hypothetical protein